MFGEEHFEISTMRLEGDYEDGRRPSRVEFINHLFDDSKRRDFTVNALYYHPRHGLIDYYNGVDHLKIINFVLLAILKFVLKRTYYELRVFIALNRNSVLILMRNII